MKKLVVNINDLRISLENPRLDHMADYQLAICEMLSNQQNKLFELAKDICFNGLNPQSTIAVYPCEHEEGKYSVAEGNRRVLAIQIMLNPHLIEQVDTTLYNKFYDLHNANKNNFSELEVSFYDNLFDKDLIHWLEVTHNGQNDGRGVVQWSGEQKARFGERFLNKPSALLNFQEYLINEKILTPEQVKEVSKTNWERILSTVCRDFLLIVKNNNEYFLPLIESERGESIRRIRAIINKIRNKSVSIVYDEEAQIKLIDEIKIELSIPNIESDPTLFDINDSQNTTISFQSVQEKNFDSAPKQSEINSTTSIRQQNIKAYKFQNLKITKINPTDSNNVGIFNVVSELRKLCKNSLDGYDCEKYPIGTLMLIRSLLENSIKYWLREKQPKIWESLTKNSNPLLSRIIETIIKFIENGHIIFSNEVDKLFIVEFGKNGTHKDFLDLIVHYPEIFSKNYKNNGMVYEIFMIANSFIYTLIEFVLNN